MNEGLFERLARSKFRSKFKLGQKEIDYIAKCGIAKIESHAQDFILKRLTDPKAFIDGKQTPMRGHPVFIAQHATGTCCRQCLSKWHNIEPCHILTDNEQNYIRDVLMSWIDMQTANEK